ncbi:hypothetical protein D3C87_1355390 [compost metagenome]
MLILAYAGRAITFVPKIAVVPKHLGEGTSLASADRPGRRRLPEPSPSKRLQNELALDAFLFAGLKRHRAQTVMPHPVDLNETAWLRAIGGEELQKAANVVSVDVRADCKS